MESVIKIDEEILNGIIKAIINLERENLKTKDLTDPKIVNKIKEIIEERLEVE